MTFAEVKRQLSIEEHDRVVNSGLLLDTDGLGPSDFVLLGLDLERTQ